MELKDFTLPYNFTEPANLVRFEVSEAIGMCRKKCIKCLCGSRIIQSLVHLNITHKTDGNPDPLFINLTRDELQQIRGYWKTQPEPETW